MYLNYYGMTNYLTNKTLLHQVFFYEKKKSKNHPIIKNVYKDTMQEHISRDTHQN